MQINKNQKYPVLESFRECEKLYENSIKKKENGNPLVIGILTELLEYKSLSCISNCNVGVLINKIVSKIYPKINNIPHNQKLALVQQTLQILQTVQDQDRKKLTNYAQIKQYQKELCSNLMHLLLHYSAARHICRLTLILTAFIQAGLVRKQIINFVLMGMILGFQQIGNKQQIQKIQSCLKIMLSKLLSLSDPNPFLIITCLIYFNKNSNLYMKEIQQLVDCPYKITSMFLKFRQQYSSEFQNIIIQCDRDFSHLSTTIIDNMIIKVIIDILLNSKIQHQLHKKMEIVLMKLIRYDLSILIVKNLLKKLEISEIMMTKQNWLGIFDIMRFALIYPTFNHQSLKFNQKKSCLFVSLEDISEIMIEYRSYRLQSEFMLFKLTNNKLLQNQIYQQIWITIRYIQNTSFYISILYIYNKFIQKIDKQTISLKMFEDNVVKLEVGSKQTKIIFVGENQTQVSVDLNNFKANSIIIGDEEQIGGFICEISKFLIISHTQKIDLIKKFRKQPEFLKSNGKLLDLIIKKSMAYIFLLLGDLELIMLIISHLIRKIQNQSILREMLQKVMDFLQEIASIKGVTGRELSLDERQKRICNVSCLSWLACRYKRHGKPILQILRFLSIRKFEKQLDNLEVLCNFALFKELKYDDFKFILEKIDRDMSSYLKRQLDNSIITKYCSQMLLDLTTFFKNTQLISQNLQEDVLHKHCHIIKIIFFKLIKLSISEILDQILLILKILYLLIDRRKQNDYIDTIMGFQITNLALKLSAHIFSRQMKLQGQKAITEEILSKKQEISIWLQEILYCLENQILYNEFKIKYFNWEAQEEKKDEIGKLQSAKQSQLVDLCEKIQVFTISGNLGYFHKLINQSLSKSQIQYFWEANLVEYRPTNAKTLQNRLNILFKYGPYGPKTQINNKELIEKLIKKSFEFVKIKPSFKMPKQFLQILCFNSISYYLNYTFQIFKKMEKQFEEDLKMKCILGQNLLYLIYSFPGASYSNTKEIRKYISQCQRLEKTLQILQSHLIIKQLVIKISNLESNSSCSKQFEQETLSKIQFFSQINSQTQSQLSQDEIQPKILCSEKFDNNQNLKTSQIQRAFEQLQLVINKSQIKKFSKNQNKQDYSQQQIDGLVQNFNINLSAIIELFSNDNCLNIQNKIRGFKSNMFFLKKHIYKFSCMIIEDYIIEKINFGPKIRVNRKKSISIERGQILHLQSQRILQDFMKERRKTLHKIERFWNDVEKNNKYFWEIFLSHDSKHQSLDPYCNELKMRGLIKIDNEKRQIQLPKGVFLSSFKQSLSASSDRERFGESMSEDEMFSKNSIYQLESSYEEKSNSKSPFKNEIQLSKKKKMKKNNQFSVMWITTTTIYQGTLQAQKNYIKFFQQIPDEALYDTICANDHERRSIIQFQKKQYCFQIFVNKKISIIPKRYLGFQTSAQISCDHKNYFIWFRKGSNRQKFLKFYENYRNVITNDEKIKQVAKKYMKKWQHGDISNFTYLMHLNDLSSRTFNDLSQYYVFPWTVINFKQKMSKEFFENQNNFRDLRKPVGALNEERLKMTLQKYKQSEKYNQISNYLYGSFYSNPAIVCNYMVRLQPFSFHHYLLQQNQFDLADRIFYSFADQFRGCYQNTGDYKELIPEFYFFPQFLRNRSQYNFGYRQNKQVVNNVELPKWNNCESPSQQSFIFGMRKALQSQIVTKKLNNWIDLIFGIYARKEKGIQKNNLFIDTIYRDKLKEIKNIKERQLCLLMYKEFGQMPRQIFSTQHEHSMKQNRKYHLIQTKPKIIIQKAQVKRNRNLDIIIIKENLIWIDQINTLHLGTYQHKNQIISSLKLFTSEEISKFQLSARTYQGQNFTHCIKCLKFLTQEVYNTKDIQALLYIKLGQLMIRYIQYQNFKKKIQIKQEDKLILQGVTNCNLFQIYPDLSLLIISQKSAIKIFKYQFKTQIQGLFATKKRNNKMIHSYIKQFTQHRSQITHLKICFSYGLLLSLDISHKLYVLKLCRDQINVIQSFKLKKLNFCQSVSCMKIHEIGYIIILTSHYNIYVYNLMGDYISKIDLDNVKECLRGSEFLTAFEIWDQQTSQIVVGTNLGHIFLIDFLYQDQYQKISIGKQQILHLNVNRVGRHWQCVCADTKNITLLRSEKYYEAFKRNY